ncbi:hypothetical protein ACIQVT_19520 [Streptomyces sp. NPDC100445]|uniref:hypothetical protein n=1 Tax=Streptomyces sp. NPDC100445 TaxID=3366102 RepID=UPI00380B9D94
MPASKLTGATKGVLVKGGLPVTLEVIEETLQDFMDAMSSLETDMSRRWPSPETGSRVPTE